MRAVVTGGAGFIGSHLVDALVARGDDVTVVDDLSTGRREFLSEHARLREHDIREPFDVEADIVFHLAAQADVGTSMQRPAFDAQVNVVGTINTLEAARAAGAEVVFASTGGAIYGEQDYFPADEQHPARPVSPYGVSKLAFERYLFYFHVAYGLDATCLRYANVYGERQNPHGEAGVVAIFLSKLLAGQAPTINGPGLQTRDYVHVSDVVQANLLALGKPGFHVYNVGTGVETSVVELYRELARAVGTDLQPKHGPAKPGEQQRSVIDARLIKSELGWPDPLPLRQGIERTAAWFRQRAEASVIAG